MASTYAVALESTLSTSNDTVPVSGANASINPRAHLIAVLPEVVEVDYTEGAEILDRAARRNLGISGEEFISLWDAGHYDGPIENVKAQEVAELLPFVRPTRDNAR